MTSLPAAMSVMEAVIFLGFTAFVIVVAIVAGIKLKHEESEDMSRVAARLGGRLKEGYVFAYPLVEFTLSGRSAWVVTFPQSRDAGPRTQVMVDVRDISPGTLHIAYEGFAESFAKIFGAQDLPIGDADFDAKYVVNATPTTVAHTIFRPEMRQRAIASVHRLWQFNEATVDLDRAHLSVSVRDRITDPAQVAELVKTVEEFLTYIVPTPPVVGIRVIDVKLSSEGRCPVCGTELSKPLVRCEACRMPHHAECWKYMGRCSTYACRGKRSVA